MPAMVGYLNYWATAAPLIWMEQRTNATLLKCSYRCDGIVVWAWVSLDGQPELLVFHGEALTSVRYWYGILDLYVCPFADAISNEFILMADNVKPH
ncbi:hypothetical protein TNCV_3461181 [Trichonephila clavipes]|nr:hypothetical protein TNCV_3461181 [Trichonephila clavipes]